MKIYFTLRNSEGLTGSIGSYSCLARFAGLAVGGFIAPLLPATAAAAAAAGLAEILGADSTA